MELTFSLQTTVFISFASLYLLIFLLRRKPNKISGGASHGFRTYPLLGTLPDFIRNRHRFLEWTTGVLARCPTNTAVFRRPGKIHGVITANPLIVEHMLKSHFDNFPKGARFRFLLQDFLGTGIFNSDGELWKIQRKTASYEFNTKSLRNFVMENVVFELKSRLVPVLESSAKTDRVLDFQDILERFAFDNICKVAFDVDPGCLEGDGTVGSEFMRAFDEAANLSSGRFMYALPSIFSIKKFFDLGSEKKLRVSIAKVHEFADRIIRTRMEEGKKKGKKGEDLLSRFISNSNLEKSNSLDFLRDIVISFILAGRDTTSSALSWFFWLLSSRPNVEQKILQELENIRVLNGKSTSGGSYYTFDELREMHYLHAAISEAMRLYPPVPVDTKACIKDDILPDGTFIGKAWFISYDTYTMGRMESVWGKDCCEYKPERWIENGVCRQESPFRYPVFHAGPRMCLGKDMAFIQMKSIAACVLERFKIDVLLEKGKCPEYLLSLTLRIKGGLPVKIKERNV
ncbi:cytochrome P450- family 94- subfamily D-polypeptide 2 [Striga hermonthica]|uniref:Cytochrome P450- family 94- subfamily D-polypeptide 2 n=1 Tax=Striga hermonthica TaxID=68872 RepID=A0A9N7MPK1_STRHE|nr:cytochrome P450- family 94- subfamily D-polypeptide 2 [Striga hermonthica]